MNAPLLTVGIPTWNRAGHLATAVDSVMAQVGDAPVEVLISDNASDDSTPAVVAALCAKYPALRAQRMSTNTLGEGNIANIAAAARGEYVWFLGDDDVIMSGALAEALDAISREKAAFYHCQDAYFKGRYPWSKGSMLELASRHGWLNLMGFISSCIIETRRLRAAVEGARWQLYYKNTFAHGCAFLDQCVDAPMVIIGRSMVAAQDAQQTADTQKRWFEARTMQRYVLVADSLSRMRADGILPALEAGFFGYHEVTLWGKICGDAAAWQQRGNFELSASPDFWRRLHLIADLLRDRSVAARVHEHLRGIYAALRAEREARKQYLVAGTEINTLYQALCRPERAALAEAA